MSENVTWIQKYHLSMVLLGLSSLVYGLTKSDAFAVGCVIFYVGALYCVRRIVKSKEVEK